MVRNLVIKVEPAEPTVSQMQFNFLGKLPLRAKAVAVSISIRTINSGSIEGRPISL
jgi:hypothetical protein